MSPSDLSLPGESEHEPLELTLEEEPAAGGEPRPEEPVENAAPRGPLTAAATAWADLFLILAVCSLAVAGARVLGYPVGVPAVPWAAALGVMSWVLAAAALLVVRRSWPGALLLGLVLPPEKGSMGWRRRLALVILGATTLGLAAAALARLDPWADLVPETQA